MTRQLKNLISLLSNMEKQKTKERVIGSRNGKTYVLSGELKGERRYWEVVGMDEPEAIEIASRRGIANSIIEIDAGITTRDSGFYSWATKRIDGWSCVKVSAEENLGLI
jgi:hypothetical protein